MRDWQSYIRRRQSGELAPQLRRGNDGKIGLTPVRARAIEEDLKLLRKRPSRRSYDWAKT